MRCMSAREAKNSFGKLIGTALVEPIAIESTDVISMAVFEQLTQGSTSLHVVRGAIDIQAAPPIKQARVTRTATPLASKSGGRR